MTSENKARASFFDEDDLAITFEFQKFEKKYERNLNLPSVVQHYSAETTVFLEDRSNKVIMPFTIRL